jgi:hypothetical protein
VTGVNQQKKTTTTSFNSTTIPTFNTFSSLAETVTIKEPKTDSSSSSLTVSSNSPIVSISPSPTSSHDNLNTETERKSNTISSSSPSSSSSSSFSSSSSLSSTPRSPTSTHINVGIDSTNRNSSSPIIPCEETTIEVTFLCPRPRFTNISPTQSFSRPIAIDTAHVQLCKAVKRRANEVPRAVQVVYLPISKQKQNQSEEKQASDHESHMEVDEGHTVRFTFASSQHCEHVCTMLNEFDHIPFRKFTPRQAYGMILWPRMIHPDDFESVIETLVSYVPSGSFHIDQDSCGMGLREVRYRIPSFYQHELLNLPPRLNCGYIQLFSLVKSDHPLPCRRCFAKDHTTFHCSLPAGQFACSSCGKQGHRLNDCEADQSIRKCLICDKNGHYAHRCNSLRRHYERIDKGKLEKQRHRYFPSSFPSQTIVPTPPTSTSSNSSPPISSVCHSNSSSPQSNVSSSSSPRSYAEAATQDVHPNSPTYNRSSTNSLNVSSSPMISQSLLTLVTMLPTLLQTMVQLLSINPIDQHQHQHLLTPLTQCLQQIQTVTSANSTAPSSASAWISSSSPPSTSPSSSSPSSPGSALSQPDLSDQKVVEIEADTDTHEETGWQIAGNEQLKRSQHKHDRNPSKNEQKSFNGKNKAKKTELEHDVTTHRHTATAASSHISSSSLHHAVK